MKFKKLAKPIEEVQEEEPKERRTMLVSKGRVLTQEDLDSVYIADVCLNPPKFFQQACHMCNFYGKCRYYGKCDYAGLRRKKLRQQTEEEKGEELPVTKGVDVVEKVKQNHKSKPKLGKTPSNKKEKVEVLKVESAPTFMASFSCDDF